MSLTVLYAPQLGSQRRKGLETGTEPRTTDFALFALLFLLLQPVPWAALSCARQGRAGLSQQHTEPHVGSLCVAQHGDPPFSHRRGFHTKHTLYKAVRMQQNTSSAYSRSALQLDGTYNICITLGSTYNSPNDNSPCIRIQAHRPEHVVSSAPLPAGRRLFASGPQGRIAKGCS